LNFNVLLNAIHNRRALKMNAFYTKKISRRKFMLASAGMLAGLGTSSLMPVFANVAPQKSEVYQQLSAKIEPNPEIKVLRWSEFVRSEKEIWLANTRRWEELTGARVTTDFLPWNELRPNAAMEAAIGTGHDIVFGFHDDPHLYPDKLVDLTDVAEYLGNKYGGWYPVCSIYGRSTRTNRWIALPVGLLGQGINYRKSRIREAGYESLPMDTEMFLKCCKALRAKGYFTGFPLGHAVGDANGWTHWWLWSFGGKTVESDGETIAINSRQTLQALDTARQLYETMLPEVGNWLDPDNNAAFLNGGISLTYNGSSIVYQAQQFNPKVYADLGVTNLPSGPVGRPVELSSISLGYVFQHTLVPNAAKHFLAYMLEAEQYGKWLENSYGYITQSLKHYYDLSFWTQDPRITPYRECASRMLPNGYAGPLGPKSAAAMSEYIVVDMFADVCMARRTPRQAALFAEKKLMQLYRKGSSRSMS
jgi:multiple sugar transport system substrate-binding protein